VELEEQVLVITIVIEMVVTLLVPMEHAILLVPLVSVAANGDFVDLVLNTVELVEQVMLMLVPI